MESIGDYEYSKKDLIGHGAFAVVFKGHLKKDPSRVVAIKCITKKNLAKSAALLSKEIKILRELSDLHHENVVALMDCKETSHHVFLIMEYCNGGDLADYLQAKGTLSEDTIALFLRHIAAALKALNSKGVVHRDLKPQNILLCHSGRSSNPPASDITLKIADFGFARFLQDGVMAATLCGSPMYMAPEVIMSLQYDAKADLWSIGTIVYQCLTGKAPFQAQTPQQLKQFYERNANLAPNVPHGTSPELKDLLLRVLKRNAKDRIEFEKFFSHPFFNPKPKVKSSSPVPVPRTRSKSSISSDSPRMQAISASPLSGNVVPSPPNIVGGGTLASSPRQPIRGQQQVEPMETGSNHGSVVSGDGNLATEQEGFVLVPENIPSDHSDGVSPKVDLNAIFSDDTPDSPRHSHRRTPSPQLLLDGLSTSPSRPSSFPVQIPVSSRPTSEPIPVPTQRKNFEMIQRSIGQSPNSPAYPAISPRKSSQGSSFGAATGMSPHTAALGTSPHPQATLGSHPQSNGNLSRKSSAVSLGTSPPHVQFSVGTPPINNNPPLPPRRGSAPVAVITKKNIAQRCQAFPPTVEESLSRQQEDSSFGPLRRARTRTCPDNLGSQAHNTEANKVLVPIGQGQQPSFALDPAAMDPVAVVKKSNSGGRLSEQLIRAAFGTQLPSPPTAGIAAHLTAHSPPPSAVVLNYGATGGSTNSLHRAGSNTSLTRVRRFSSNEPPESPMTIPENSPNMEAPVSFVAPDLAEETLMDSVHKDTVNKINFVLALVECIIEIANMKSSMLSESIVIAHSPGSTSGSDKANDNPDQNRVEELLLMVRALQLLGATIQLAKEEVEAKRLHPSTTVKTILVEMTSHYHKCLQRCKDLHKMGITDNANMSASIIANTADRIIYTYAIEMCQTAALDELFGNPKECFHHYRNAHILLHSLAEKANDSKDKELLSRYRESVEKRIMALHNQGLIDSFNTARTQTNR